MIERQRPDAGESENRTGGKSIEEWHPHLTGENLDVPASRYGRDASACAWWAIAALYAFDLQGGVSDSADDLVEDLMTLAVNDSPDVMDMVLDSYRQLPAELTGRLTVERSES